MADEVETNEEHWMRGHRAATVSMLGHCLRQLAYDPDPSVELARLVYEREQTIAKLREACDEYGDNDWDEKLHMADIVEKHLIRPLEARFEEEAMDAKGDALDRGE